LILNEKSWRKNCDLVIFDELHKMKNWKSWVKGTSCPFRCKLALQPGPVKNSPEGCLTGFYNFVAKTISLARESENRKNKQKKAKIVDNSWFFFNNSISGVSKD